MIEYLIGVDGGGTGTRVRIAHAGGPAPGGPGPGGPELAQGQSGPSGLAHGVRQAWAAVGEAVAAAFAAAGIAQPAPASIAIGLGLAGVHNREWAAQFVAASPGYAALVLETDAFTTLVGAHQGRPGAIVAIGTGSVGQVLLANGERREVGGWGFPAGDEASGGWIGLRAVNHIQQVLDGRKADSPFAREVADACGGRRDAIQVWLGKATQTTYATLARIVVAHAASDPTARAILEEAGREVASMARALDPAGELPLALCGGLGGPLRAYLPAELLARAVAPQGDAASGALRMIELHLKKDAQQ